MAVQADTYYLYLDDPQVVTVRSRRTGTEQADTVSYASRLSNRKAQSLFGGIALNSNQQGWNIPAALLSNVTDFRRGDTITESNGDLWIVEEVMQDALKTQWNLKCEKGKD